MNDLVEELAKPVVEMIHNALIAEDYKSVSDICKQLSISAFPFVMEKLSMEDRILVTCVTGRG